jgi:hypothetical protein
MPLFLTFIIFNIHSWVGPEKSRFSGSPPLLMALVMDVAHINIIRPHPHHLNNRYMNSHIFKNLQ